MSVGSAAEVAWTDFCYLAPATVNRVPPDGLGPEEAPPQRSLERLDLARTHLVERWADGPRGQSEAQTAIYWSWQQPWNLVLTERLSAGFENCLMIVRTVLMEMIGSLSLTPTKFAAAAGRRWIEPVDCVRIAVVAPKRVGPVAGARCSPESIC